MTKSLISPLLALVLAPFLLTIINKTKALFGGRIGPAWFQPYYDLWKLLHKGAVYSETTSWVFRLAPTMGLASIVIALLLMPFGDMPAPLHFQGDMILFAYLLGLSRFITVMGALDTGSSFEGMGASREVSFAALDEPAMFLGLAAIARATHSLSLTSMHDAITATLWIDSGLVLSLVAVALMIVFLAENSRIPVDDPNTHLELTMIHEVMILDNSGPDLAYILYGTALKTWLMGALVVDLMLPAHISFGPVIVDDVLNILVDVVALALLAVVVGIIESSMARLRLVRITQLLVGASALSILALILGN